MNAALILTVVLIIMEYLFWLSPLTPRLNTMMKRMGDWYLLLPFHYLLRLMALGAVLLAFRPTLWPGFAGSGQAWGLSLACGGLLALVNWVGVGLRPARIRPREFWTRADAWRRAAGWRFWVDAAYIAVYPGFVEELLFRWFVPAALWPHIGWWAAAAAPLLMLVWHLPVWYFGTLNQPNHWRVLASIAIPATLFAGALTFVSVWTQNLAGPVLAHAIGDWVGGVGRHHAARAVAQQKAV